eukprot:4218005-Prymnesium_polylepis.1
MASHEACRPPCEVLARGSCTLQTGVDLIIHVTWQRIFTPLAPRGRGRGRGPCPCPWPRAPCRVRPCVEPYTVRNAPLRKWPIKKIHLRLSVKI